MSGSSGGSSGSGSRNRSRSIRSRSGVGGFAPAAASLILGTQGHHL